MDPAAEHLWVRTACGLTAREGTACIDVTGEDRVKLLQGLLANDVEKLRPGQGCLTHLLTPKGKIQAQMEALVLTDRLRLLCESSQADAILKTIQMRIFRSQVKLEDRRKDLSVIGLHGPKSPEVLAKALGQTIALEKEYDHASKTLDGIPVEIVREHYTGEIGFDWMIPTQNLEQIKTRLASIDEVKPVGTEAIDTLTMEAGFPQWGIDLTEDNLSLEANLNKAVSNSKGCYLGQETVARMLSRGHVAKRLVGLVLESGDAVAAGTRVFPEAQTQVTETDRPLGIITRSALSPTLKKPLALSYLKFEFLEDHPNARVSLFDASGARLGFAHWQNLPFIEGSAPVWLAGGPQMERVVAPQSRTR